MPGGKFEANIHDINDEFYCEACNRSWSSAEALQEHIAEHEVCGREGCNFSAHPKIVALHVSFHHSTGLYKKIANVQSPEDIAKWIAERKSRYPTEANVAKRVAKEKEMIERGERVEENKTEKNNRPKRGEAKPNNRTNWKERFRKNRENSEKKEAPKQNLALSDEENDDPKKNWNANLPPFQGLISLPTVCDEINPNFDAEGNTVLCCDGFENDNSSELLPPKELCSTTEVKNCLEVPVADVKKEDILSSDCALGTAPANQQESTNISCPNETANTGAISDNMISNHVDTPKLDVDEIADCSTSNQTDESKVPLVPYDEDMDDENGGSEPEECPIMKSTDPSVQTPLESETVTDNVNDSNETTNQKRSRKRQRHHGNSDKKQDPVKKENVVRNRKLTLLEKLLSKEIRHERNVILQCVHYVVSNQFFDNDKGIKSWMDDSDSDSCSD